MNSVKKVTIVCSCLSAIAGFALAVNFVAIPIRHEVQDEAVRACEMNLIALRLIQQNEVSELVKRQERALDASAELLGGELRHHPGAGYFLWEIREYYRKSSKPKSDKLPQILESLPEQKPAPKRLYFTGP